MSLDQIRSARFRKAVENTFRADAALDATLFAAGLTEGATFRLGGNPPVSGRKAVQEMLEQTFGAFRTVRHSLAHVYEETDTLLYEATVTYDMKDGRRISADYVNVLRFEGALVDDYRVYIDLSALRPA
jgi:ketosteroid isomerase-like protein